MADFLDQEEIGVRHVARAHRHRAVVRVHLAHLVHVRDGILADKLRETSLEKTCGVTCRHAYPFEDGRKALPHDHEALRAKNIGARNNFPVENLDMKNLLAELIRILAPARERHLLKRMLKEMRRGEKTHFYV